MYYCGWSSVSGNIAICFGHLACSCLIYPAYQILPVAVRLHSKHLWTIFNRWEATYVHWRMAGPPKDFQRHILMFNTVLAIGPIGCHTSQSSSVPYSVFMFHFDLIR